MKRFLMLCCCHIVLLSAGQSAHAQSTVNFYDQPYTERNNGTFAKGTQIASFGYGLANISGTAYINSNLQQRTAHTNIGPLYLKYEYGIADAIGLGVYGTYAFSTERLGQTDFKNYRTNAISFGVNGFYHFNKVIHVENLDLYAGLGFGFKHISVRTSTEGEQATETSITDNSGVF